MELFQQANTWLIDTFGELGPLFAIAALGVLLILLTLPMFLQKQVDPMDRLKGTGGGHSKAKVEEKQALRYSDKRIEKLDKFASFLEPQDEKEMSNARVKMMRAGYRGKNSVRVFHFAKLVLGIGFLTIGFILSLIGSATGDVTIQQLLLTVIIPGAIGYYLPQYWVTRRIQAREEEVINGFPDSLDMMLVCVEAGQSLDQAIIRVSKEIVRGYPALAEEYEIVAHEMKAGKDRTSVLRDMSERCGVSDIGSFVTVLVQSAQFGTSIADALRVFSDEMRDKRVMRAEEKANTIPTKLTLGTMMFTVPPLLIALIGPSIYEIYNTLGNASLF